MLPDDAAIIEVHEPIIIVLGIAFVAKEEPELGDRGCHDSLDLRYMTAGPERLHCGAYFYRVTDSSWAGIRQ